MNSGHTNTPELRITLDGPVPVYRQVADQIRTLAMNGRLMPGHALPSIRQVAARLGVHFNTIAEAYRVLAEEGWVEVEQGRGAVVRDRGRVRPPSRTEAIQHSSRLHHLIAELRGNGLSVKWIRREFEAALIGGGQ